jgi:mevalonate kinase
MKTTSAPAKVILLGEHTSLYGNPALVAALDMRAKVSVSKRNDNEVRVTAPGLGLEDAPAKRSERGTALVKRAAELYGGGYDIQVESNVPLASGLGSSAAISAALVMALDAENGQDSDLHVARKGSGKVQKTFSSHMRVLQEKAQLCESEVHSKSSGLDTAASVYGGAIRYQRGEVERINMGDYPRLIIAHSGVQSDTAEIVEHIDRINAEDPERMKFFLDESERLVFLGQRALESGDWETLGKQMSANHKLLADMEVSSERLEELVCSAKDAGAYGAKLCGAGRGGVMAALVDENCEKEVNEALSRKDAKIMESSISEEGVTLE